MLFYSLSHNELYGILEYDDNIFRAPQTWCGPQPVGAGRGGGAAEGGRALPPPTCSTTNILVVNMGPFVHSCISND